MLRLYLGIATARNSFAIDAHIKLAGINHASIGYGIWNTWNNIINYVISGESMADASRSLRDRRLHQLLICGGL